MKFSVCALLLLGCGDLTMPTQLYTHGTPPQYSNFDEIRMDARFVGTYIGVAGDGCAPARDVTDFVVTGINTPSPALGGIPCELDVLEADAVLRCVWTRKNSPPWPSPSDRMVITYHWRLSSTGRTANGPNLVGTMTHSTTSAAYQCTLVYGLTQVVPICANGDC